MTVFQLTSSKATFQVGLMSEQGLYMCTELWAMALRHMVRGGDKGMDAHRLRDPRQLAVDPGAPRLKRERAVRRLQEAADKAGQTIPQEVRDQWETADPGIADDGTAGQVMRH